MNSYFFSRKAFSLVEVVLALGLVSFCLLAIVGLLPTGLRSVKNASAEAAAVNALNYLDSAIRNATTTDGTDYVANGTYNLMTWSLDGAARTFADIPINLGGLRDETDVRFKAHVEVIAPAGTNAPGRALVTVAWPVASTWVEGQWKGAEGSVSSGIIFLPK